jgi:hypothetical protein
MQRAGKLAQAIDPESLACVIMVFVMELMHMETLLPHLSVRDLVEAIRHLFSWSTTLEANRYQWRAGGAETALGNFPALLRG